MATAPTAIGILGVGFSVPERVRTNGDPLFDWLIEASPKGLGLFTGYRDRRYLGPGEDVTGLMMDAVEATLKDADCLPDDVGLLLGYVSVSDYLNPNALGAVHEQLELPKSTPIIPVNNEFNNYPMAIVIAQGLMQAGMPGNALIVCASNWSRHVDYHTPQAISAGDGAGALVLGPVNDDGDWVIADHATGVWSQNFGAMYMRGAVLGTDYDCSTNPHHCTFTTPFFQISEAGIKEYQEFGVTGVPDVVNGLLKENGLEGGDIALVTHQSSAYLIDRWRDAIKPSTYVQTLEQYGNMCIANLPVSLASGLAHVKEDHLVVCGIGVEGQVNAVLLSRKPG